MQIIEIRTQRYLLASIGIYALIAIISIAYGFQYIFAGEAKAIYFRLMTIPFFIVLGALTFGAFIHWRKESIEPIAGHLGFIIMSGSFLMSCHFYSYKLPLISWMIIAYPVIIIAMLVHIKWHSRGSTITYLLAITVLYALFITNTPHTDGANMLELIEEVLLALFTGSNPYDMDYMPITAYKLGYMPTLWLPYSIPYLLGIDIRIINILCLAAIVLLFERSLGNRTHKSVITSLTIYPIILSPPVAQMITHGHVLPYWFYIISTVAALYKERLFLASVMFGLALAARQPSVFLIPLFAVYVYNRTSFAGFLKYSLPCLLVYAAIVIPFSSLTGSEFWLQTYLNMVDEVQEGFLIHQINGSGFLYSLGLKDILSYIQLLILLIGTVVIAMNSHRGTSWFIYFAALIYIWDVFFNIYVARYIYIPAIICLAFAIATSVPVKQDAGEK